MAMALGAALKYGIPSWAFILGSCAAILMVDNLAHD